MEPFEVLNKYWAHASFRPFQEEIINAILSNNDTLAILPTGGGKSICFQIPGLLSEGATLVISPLIALMNDQVDNLKQKNISAIAFHSGLTRRETEMEYANIRHGKYKFIYVSPERIKTERFKDVVANTPINLLAIDEAHCISQWGYDFRPEYRLIVELRKILKNVPCLALTASATPAVQHDIITLLEFKGTFQTFRQTTVRPNLRYAVVDDENKDNRLIKITSKLKGSGIVYVKTRKTAASLSGLMNKHGVVADYYHAGLPLDTRNMKQTEWQKGFTRVMLCTNAFGMGIDKSNVRFVVHYDIPESPEAYYQESGRAGRDGNDSWCILLYCSPDKMSAENLILSRYLDKKYLQVIFNALCNHFQLPYWSGYENTFELDVRALSEHYKFPVHDIKVALGMLQKEGLLKLSDAFSNPSRLRIIANQTELYRFYLANASYEVFIKTILRMYGGIFDNYVPISEFELSKNLTLSVDKVRVGLEKLTALHLFDYIPQNEKPIMTMLMDRPETIPYNKTLWEFLKKTALERFKAMVTYAETKNCRQNALASYFGETNATDCGKCDACRASKQPLGNNLERIKGILSQSFSHDYFSIESIVEFMGGNTEDIEALRYLIDTDNFNINSAGHYKWKVRAKK